MNYCPQCANPLTPVIIDGEHRRGCAADACNFVFWNNPTPVVAMIVEVDEGVVLAHNAAWKHDFFSIITGFLEQQEDPQVCAHRETEEELGLQVIESSLVGVYSFAEQNQVIIAYHVRAQGDIKLNHELDAYKIVPKEKLKGWDMGTGLAINDWVAAQGFGV
ncbi:NUDIX domain-containing protein [Oceanicoccus sp. KOV_DT_Chl]|uniref:NUDIX domain-containing protein n=1 Tax=Oceanicoccus sp. KOV_DT_Chl TaxID=1904639 RepID=UPI000C7E7003|nr:NUDIX domain-containing protein [Oceanicoccus sp. KOV_DT_Chl]